ncbi:YacP-like NYN domain protein [compost metagenome]
MGELSHRRRQIYVATSDFVEQHVIFAQGALRISARELKLEIEENQKQVKKAIEPEIISSKRHSLEEKLPPEMRRRLEDWRRQ